jgi:hypothetical protein
MLCQSLMYMRPKAFSNQGVKEPLVKSSTRQFSGRKVYHSRRFFNWTIGPPSFTYCQPVDFRPRRVQEHWLSASTLQQRTWVPLREAVPSGWGIAGTAFSREEFTALATWNAQIVNRIPYLPYAWATWPTSFAQGMSMAA